MRIRSTRLYMILFGLTLAFGCEKGQTLVGKWEYKEIGRFVSPDSKVDAVEVMGSAGAGTTLHTYIFLVPHGAKLDADNNAPLFNGDYVDKLDVRWRKQQFLEIHYNEAQIVNFRNYWQSQELDNFHYLVEIMIYPNKDRSLPSALTNW